MDNSTLLIGYDFFEVLNILLPYSIVISFLQIFTTKDRNFEFGKKDRILGTELLVFPNKKITGNYTIHIDYETSSEAKALQWLKPEQTNGKTKPFLFTQSQAILARSWIPIQDGPGIRFCYKAKIKVPKGMMALMSASNPKKLSHDGIYEFEMKQPIPAYLMALAIGDII